MGIMSDEPHPDYEPLVNDEELDGFWDKWSWTNQLYFIACQDEDDDRIVRANTVDEAVQLFREDSFQHHRWRKVAYVYRIPTEPGLTKVLEWRSPDLPDLPWPNDRVTSRGKKP